MPVTKKEKIVSLFFMIKKENKTDKTEIYIPAINSETINVEDVIFHSSDSGVELGCEIKLTDEKGIIYRLGSDDDLLSLDVCRQVRSTDGVLVIEITKDGEPVRIFSIQAQENNS